MVVVFAALMHESEADGISFSKNDDESQGCFIPDQQEPAGINILYFDKPYNVLNTITAVKTPALGIKLMFCPSLVWVYGARVACVHSVSDHVVLLEHLQILLSGSAHGVLLLQGHVQVLRAGGRTYGRHTGRTSFQLSCH